tara:strand:- start:7163 stop:7684 length:522 start_codon:yes stop_codon:yes gene_type:complete
MSESKIVYVNDDYDSDQDNAIIYGSDDVTVDEVKPSIIEEPLNDIVEDGFKKPEVEEVTKNNIEDGVENLESKEEVIVNNVEVVENDDDLNENEGSIFGGGDGYKSEPDDASSVSSLDTDAILNVDPLYFRLTKFLQTGGDEPENVAEILKKINTNLEFMNQNLMKLMNIKAN